MNNNTSIWVRQQYTIDLHKFNNQNSIGPSHQQLAGYIRALELTSFFYT